MRQSRGDGVRLVYVSPLKALSYDIERNLRAPLRGIGADISVGLRTGDTPQKERRAMRENAARHPDHDARVALPDALLGRARDPRQTEAVIVDEIHAVAQTKRGAHLALTLERLDRLVKEAGEDSSEQQRGGSAESSRRLRSIQRIGLSATQRPLERIAQFLVGPKRECKIVDAGIAKELDLEIVVPVEDMAEPGSSRLPQ